MLRVKVVLLFFAVLIMVSETYAQSSSTDSTNVSTDSTSVITHENLELLHSPKTATIWSACLPGAGQIYNKKYWKAPVIWIGIGTSIYLSQVYRSEYQFYKNEYILELGYPATQSQFHGQASLASLEDVKDSYKQWMETSYIVAGVIYILQILDANVDAQLMSFDVSDNLSLNIIPDAIPNDYNPEPVLGLTLTLNHK